MDEKYIRDRISFLRTEKDISEYKMSLDLGHSKGYIQGISSGRSMPSMSEFLYICEYFGITPKEFFDEGTESPLLVHELNELISDMPESDLNMLIDIAKRLKKKK
ncbi:MAG: helix-turn-helix transcriptional regulator [Clostridia bacterium]|nr:helix-turn-helix transcriptional regulator [Clostridia bacterium]